MTHHLSLMCGSCMNDIEPGEMIFYRAVMRHRHYPDRHYPSGNVSSGTYAAEMVAEPICEKCAKELSK